MAEDREDLVLRLLREMRESLRELKQGQDAQKGEISSLRKDIQDWQETIATTTGFAMHANVRNQQLENRVEDLTKRVEALEHAR